MKQVILIFLVGYVGCSSAKQAPIPPPDPKPPLREFTEANFGVTFNHSLEITTEHNPHGGADRVVMFRNGTFIGGLLIHPPFPTTDDAQFIQSGKEYFVETLDASSVEHRVYVNPRGYKFDVFKATITRDEITIWTERYMYRRQRVPKDEAQAFLDSMFGVFQFEFIAPANEYPSIQNDVQVIVETFRLTEKDAD